MDKRIVWAALALIFSGAMAAFAPSAMAQNSGQTAARGNAPADQATLDQLKSQLELYRKQVEAQQSLLTQQTATLHKLERALNRQASRVEALERRQASVQAPARTVAVTNAPARYIPVAQQVSQPSSPENGTAVPQQPVGQAPGPEPRPEVHALADLGGVLTPRGVLSVEPSIEFDHISTNQLIFRGISIVQGLLIGVIDATDVRGDTVIGALTARYGVTNRLELEAKVPYFYRDSHEIDVPSTSNAHPFRTYKQGHGIGDVEVAAHYQLNSGNADWPIFVANLRYKSDTGKGPFDVAFDPTNAAPKALPTGSGFQSLQPSLTMIYRSDPVVLFGSLEYDHNFSTYIGKAIAQTCGPQNNKPCLVGEATPGDSFGATLGMAVALNEATSLTLGYQHYYIGGSDVLVSGTKTRSDALQVGSLLVGASYQLGPRVGINFTTQIGATTDAPDVRVILRIPIRLDIGG